MTDAESALVAVRLFAAAAGLLLAPGLALLGALRVRARWPEHTLLAFAASYAWVFVLSIVVPLSGWTIDSALALTVVLIAVLIGTAVRRRSVPLLREGDDGGHTATYVVIVVLLGAALAGWVIEPPFTGEEALDFASLSRFADGGPVTLDNTSLLPDTRAVYLVQPYQLAVGAISRWAAVDPLIAFIKFRAVLAPLCLVVIYALLRSLTPTRLEGFVAFIVIVVFAALEIETWEVNSLFPFVRRGTLSAGVLMPALMALCVLATRSSGTGVKSRIGNIAILLTPVVVVAATVTHALEVFTFLFFLAALMVVVITRLDRAGSVRRAALLGAGIAIAVAVFLAIHSRAIPYRAGWDQAEKETMRGELGGVLHVNAIATDLADGGGSLLARQSPLTTAATLGIPGLVLLGLRMPATAATLALATVPLALIYATRAGNIVIALVTSPQFSRDVDPYFMILGILGLALGVVAAAQAILAPATGRFHPFAGVGVAAGLVVGGGAVAAEWLGAQASLRPGLFLHLAVASAVAVIAMAGTRRFPVIKGAPFPGALAAAAIVLAIPLAIPGLVFGGPYEREANTTVLGRFAAAIDRPGVFELPAYYEELGRTISPRLPVPGAVIDDIRRHIEPRRVLLANPAYSCALVVFVNAYCVNPAYVYGLFFQTATPYLTEYVRRDARGSTVHPFFNSDTTLWREEATLLERYGISHILADPEHAHAVDAKLAQAAAGADLLFERDGYRFYRVD